MKPVAGGGAWLAAAGTLAVSAWLVFQRGVMPADPVPAGLAAGMVLIWIRGAVVLAAVAAAAWGYGGVTGARGTRRWALGLALWLGVNYAVALVGAGGWGFSAAAVWGNIGTGVALWGYTAWAASKRDALPPPRALPALPWTAVLGMPGLAVLGVAAACPPGTMWRVEAAGYDVTSYHLQIPREWIAAGGMVELEHSVYAYLPGLVEAGYAALAVLRHTLFGTAGGADAVESAVYVCQLFHTGLAVLAAALTGSLVTAVSGGRRAAGGFAAALFLLTPWVQVTGSLAYNEMAVLVFAAAGLGVVLAPGQAGQPGRWVRDAAWVGLLAGAATLAKPTAGYAVAVPLGLLLVVGGAVTPRETRNVARFVREGGVPVVWLLAGAGLVGTCWRRRAAERRAQDDVKPDFFSAWGAALALVGFGAWQFAGWLGWPPARGAASGPRRGGGP